MFRLVALIAAIAAFLLFWPRRDSIGSPQRPPVSTDTAASPQRPRVSQDNVVANAEPSARTGNNADHREWQLVAAADGEACRNELTALGVKFRPLPDRTEPDANGCGIPHGVIVTRGPLGV